MGRLNCREPAALCEAATPGAPCCGCGWGRHFRELPTSSHFRRPFKKRYIADGPFKDRSGHDLRTALGRRRAAGTRESGSVEGWASVDDFDLYGQRRRRALLARLRCSASTVVGTRIATCLPLSMILNVARIASSVLP